jgi:light-independent protochlorophyllide reductase subunit B
MGLEEHLLQMFREDVEFNDSVPSHLGHAIKDRSSSPAPELAQTAANTAATTPGNAARWAAEAEKELGKIPFFVRGKARRNTERYAEERKLAIINIETLYDAKAHYSR